MTPNGDLFARYPDLLGGEADFRLMRVVGDLDALLAAVAPPRYLAGRLEGAIVAHLANEPEGETRTSLRSAGALAPFAAGTPNGRRAPRRWQTLVATAAAFTVVALMAVLLTSLGRGGIGGESPDQRFARLGGVRIVAIAECSAQAGNCGGSASLQRDVNILHSRIVDRFGPGDSLVRLQSDGSILVEVAGAKENDEGPVAVLLARGCIDVIATGGTEVPTGTDMSQPRVTYLPLVTCGSVDPHSVSVQTDPQTGQPVVTLAFTGADQASLADYTSSHIGKYLTFALDGSAIESATIQSAITGTAEIFGFPDLRAAQTIATLMRYGPLPTPLEILSEQIVPPSGAQACSSATPTVTPTATAAGPIPPATPTATPPPTPTPGSGAKISFAASVEVTGCPTPTPPPTPTPGAQSTPTWTSTGEVRVPDVLGLTATQAKNELIAVNLRKVIDQPSTLPAGYVFKTDPPAGTSVLPSTPILVYVSAGAATPTPSPTVH